MDCKNILVTGVGGDIGQSIVRCLKDVDDKINVFGCDVDFYAAGKIEVNAFYQSPWTTDENVYLSFVLGMINEFNIKYIIPTTEAEIVFFDKHRESFNKNVNVLINSSNIIKLSLDKFKTVDFLKKNQLPYPKTVLLEEYSGELTFPFLLKPREGCGNKKNVVIRDDIDLAFYKQKVSRAIVQEIVGNVDDEYTVGVFSDQQNVQSIAFRRYLGYGSLTKVAHLVRDENIGELAKNIAFAINLKGSINVQMRKQGGIYIPFEINPRFSSTVSIRHHFGFRDVKWWIDMIDGKCIEYVQKYKKGTAVRIVREIFFDLDEKNGGFYE